MFCFVFYPQKTYPCVFCWVSYKSCVVQVILNAVLIAVFLPLGLKTLLVLKSGHAWVLYDRFDVLMQQFLPVETKILSMTKQFELDHVFWFHLVLNVLNYNLPFACVLHFTLKNNLLKIGVNMEKNKTEFLIWYLIINLSTAPYMLRDLFDIVFVFVCVFLYFISEFCDIYIYASFKNSDKLKYANEWLMRVYFLSLTVLNVAKQNGSMTNTRPALNEPHKTAHFSDRLSFIRDSFFGPLG